MTHVANRVPWSTIPTQGHQLPAAERALFLGALDLDPRFTYTDHELQTAWRRRKAEVSTDPGGRSLVASVNAAYVTLISQAEIPRPIAVRL
jgi:hypothetical protein